MAKRNTKQGMYQQRQAQPKGRASSGKSASASASKSARASSVRSYNRTAQTAPSVPAGANPLIVRIAAIIIVVAAVVGGIAWAMSLQGNFGAAQIVGLIALGFLAGLGLAVALRTEQIVTQVTKMLRDRR